MIAGLVATGQTDVGGFRVPEVNGQGVLTSLMIGESARMYPDKPMDITNLTVRFFEEDGQTVNVEITSPGCAYDTRRNVATSDQSVLIVGNTFTIEGVGYVYESNKSQMKLMSDVKVTFSNLNFKPDPVSKPETESTERIETEHP
ncbi:MAG: LPS export ABC transporter periplasmic protein LptC [Kiritimatiellia bacterium]